MTNMTREEIQEFQAALDKLVDLAVSNNKPSLPVNLDEAAEEYSLPFRGSRDIWKSDIIDAFKAGVKWQKQKMMEGAVEGYVNYYEDSGGILMAEAQVGCPYHNGDKVRIIILPKEDEQ